MNQAMLLVSDRVISLRLWAILCALELLWVASFGYWVDPTMTLDRTLVRLLILLRPLVVTTVWLFLMIRPLRALRGTALLMATIGTWLAASLIIAIGSWAFSPVTFVKIGAPFHAVNAAAVVLVAGVLTAFVRSWRAKAREYLMDAQSAERILFEQRQVFAAVETELSRYIGTVADGFTGRVGNMQSQLTVIRHSATPECASLIGQLRSLGAEIEQLGERDVRRLSHRLHTSEYSHSLETALHTLAIALPTLRVSIGVNVDRSVPAHSEVGLLVARAIAVTISDVLDDNATAQIAVDCRIEKSRIVVTLQGDLPIGILQLPTWRELNARARYLGGSVHDDNVSKSIVLALPLPNEIRPATMPKDLAEPSPSGWWILGISLFMFSLLATEANQGWPGWISHLSAAALFFMFTKCLRSSAASSRVARLSRGVRTVSAIVGIAAITLLLSVFRHVVLFVLSGPDTRPLVLTDPPIMAVGIIAIIVTVLQIDAHVRLKRVTASLIATHTRWLRTEFTTAVESLDARRDSVAVVLHSRMQSKLIVATALLEDAAAHAEAIAKDQAGDKPEDNGAGRTLADRLTEVDNVLALIVSDDIAAIRRIGSQEPLADLTADLSDLARVLEGIRSLDVTLSAPNAVLTKSTRDAIVTTIWEAVGNALTHGRARQIDIIVTAEDSSATVVVTDDGMGVAPNRVAGLGSQIFTSTLSRWALDGRSDRRGTRFTGVVALHG